MGEPEAKEEMQEIERTEETKVEDENIPIEAEPLFDEEDAGENLFDAEAEPGIDAEGEKMKDELIESTTVAAEEKAVSKEDFFIPTTSSGIDLGQPDDLEEFEETVKEEEQPLGKDGEELHESSEKLETLEGEPVDGVEEGEGDREGAEEEGEEEVEEEGEGEEVEEFHGKRRKKMALKFEAEDELQEKKQRKTDAKIKSYLKRKSIAYAAVSRFRTGDEQRVSGDFEAMLTDTFDVTKPLSIQSFDFDSTEFSTESFEEEEEEEEDVQIDRDYYYNIYRSLAPQRAVDKMKNNFLQKKMAEYFKKRKMEHVLKEADNQIDSQQKYEKKLDDLDDLRDFDERERNSIGYVINDMRSQRDEQNEALNSNFFTMQNREREIGNGLINTKTGKPIADKVLDRFLKRQLMKWSEVSQMRLIYIKVRDKVAEKKAALHALDSIGGNLHLIDYEQLKIENQSYTEKIEERDEELNKLRIKCQSAMQCLAHIREKSAAILLDTVSLTERYDEVDMDYMECRERLSYSKQDRDNYRSYTEKLRQESGLLNKPKLLMDMERLLDEAKLLDESSIKLKMENKNIKLSLVAIKQNINTASTKLQTIKPVVEKSKSTHSKGLYKGRPSLIFSTMSGENMSTNDILE